MSQPNDATRSSQKSSSRVFVYALILSLAVHLGIAVLEPLWGWFKPAPPVKALKPLSIQLIRPKVQPKPPAPELSKPKPESTISKQPHMPVAPAGKPVSKPKADIKKIKESKKPPQKIKPTPMIQEEATTESEETAVHSVVSPEAEAVPPESKPDNSAPEHTNQTEPIPQPEAAFSQEATSAGQNTENEVLLSYFPKKATIKYQGYLGKIAVGMADIVWWSQGDRYQLDVRLRPIIGANIRYESYGHISSRGLRPDHFIEKRGDQIKSKLDFDYEKHVLRTQDGREEALTPSGRLQDIISVIYHTGFLGGQVGSEPIQIAAPRKSYERVLQTLGQDVFEDFDVIVYQALSEQQEVQFALAPAIGNLPIRVIFQDKGQRIELQAMRIDVEGQTIWQNR